MITLLLIATGTAVATGLGAIPVFFLGERAAALQPVLWGVAAGVMAVASVVGLLLPALDEGSSAEVAGGLVAGVAFLLVARRLSRRRETGVETVRAAGVRTSILVFTVLFVHSLPEGFAIGTAYASDVAGLGAYVILAITLQNIPEGTSVAIPMASAGYSRSRQFWAAVLTSAPQPIGAVIAYLAVETIESLLPVSFAFAAGAMLSLVASDLAPGAFRDRPGLGALGALAGGAVMLAATVLLKV